MAIDEKKLSNRFNVKRLQKTDADKILNLCIGNKLFYEYHPPLATKESIWEDMAALPPNKEYCDKYYLGYYDADFLVAVMDLILDYPENRIAYIGFFMVDASCQGKNIGTWIIEEAADYLKEAGFKKVRLAIDEGNPQSESFWIKNHFLKTGQRYPNDFSAYIPMERDFSCP